MRIEVVRGDITKLSVDVVVNAANSGLLGGGGVDGAIHRAAGPRLLEECRQLRAERGGCPPGQAVITGAGNLPARYVIHAVGPVWQGGAAGEATLLASCYLTALHLAEEKGARSIAFPNISTGVYGYPKELAAKVVHEAIRSFSRKPGSIERIVFVTFDEENHALYRELFQDLDLL